MAMVHRSLLIGFATLALLWVHDVGRGDSETPYAPPLADTHAHPGGGLSSTAVLIRSQSRLKRFLDCQVLGRSPMHWVRQCQRWQFQRVARARPLVCSHHRGWLVDCSLRVLC